MNEKSLNPVESPKEMTFHHLKSNSYKVVHCDGFILGPTPHGQIQLTVFNERVPIPQMTFHQVKEDGTIDQNDIPAKRITKTGVVREIECTLVMDLKVANAFVQQMGTALEQINRMHESLASGRRLPEEG